MGWRDILPWNKPKPQASPRYDDLNDGDLLVLEQLTDASADLTLPREIIHFLYLPNRAAATVAAENLQMCGYSAQVGMASNAIENPPNPWVIQATITALANRETITEARRIFTELATKLDGEYDGWEAATRP